MRVFCLVFWLAASSVQADLSAYQVMEKVDKRYVGDSMISTQTMVLINRRGQKLIRKLRSYSIQQGEDSKTLLFLMQPADVRNIGFLSYRWDSLDKDDQNWMFLPALDRVERLPQSNRSNAFMGSDFSYSDIAGYKLAEWNYHFIERSTQLDGHEVYLIEARPKSEFLNKVLDETGYERVEYWVSKKMDLVLQSRMYFANSSKTKLLKVDHIRKVGNIDTPHKLTMKTYKGDRLEHVSIILVDEISYNQQLDSAMFTPGRLRQGL